MKSRTAAVIALVTAAGLVLSAVTLWGWAQDRAELRVTDAATPVAASRVASADPEWVSTLVEQRRGKGLVRTVPRSDAGVGAGAGRSATEARPVKVTLPSVGVRMPIRPVGVSPDGQMRLPADPRVLGWYRFGPAPGATSGGSVVLAGHLDSTQYGVGPLLGLRDVTAGQSIDVVTSTGRLRSYVVAQVDRYDRQQLPAALFTRQGPELLRLITCGGEYDPRTGYEQNLVVTARPA